MKLSQRMKEEIIDCVGGNIEQRLYTIFTIRAEQSPQSTFLTTTPAPTPASVPNGNCEVVRWMLCMTSMLIDGDGSSIAAKSQICLGSLPSPSS